jgi:hypothetical protein
LKDWAILEKSLRDSARRIQQADAAGGEFEKAIKQLPPPPKPKKNKK